MAFTALSKLVEATGPLTEVPVLEVIPKQVRVKTATMNRAIMCRIFSMMIFLAEQLRCEENGTNPKPMLLINQKLTNDATGNFIFSKFFSERKL
jgi:hypothetical protein